MIRATREMSRDLAPASPKEPLDIQVLRGLLHRWPFPRGKGAILRAFSPMWEGREFLIAVERDVFVPAALDDYMVYWVFVNGYHRDAVVRLSRELMLPGDRVLDVGANIGLWAMGAARAVGAGGAVHAIEPIPENHARLVSNLALNGLTHVRTAQVAFSSRSGPITMFRPSYGNSGHPSLGRREGVDLPVAIEAITLDDYCEREGLTHVDFVKIDVEGAELLVLQGATKLLASQDAPVILFEVNEDTARMLGVRTADVKKLLAANGYELYEFDGRRLRAVEPVRWEIPGDVFAFRDHHYRRFSRLRALGAGEQR